MPRKKFVPGNFIMVILSDGSYGYGRLREFPIASFYDYRTEEPEIDLDKIASTPILFTVAVHKSVLTKWKIIGNQPLDEKMRQPVWQFRQAIGNFRKCEVFDLDGNVIPVTPKECEGLERAGVWEAKHVEDRLLNTFMDKPDPNVEHMKVRYQDP